MLTDFLGKRAALAGGGKENISLIPFLLKRGATVTLLDKNPDPAQVEELKRLYDIAVIQGPQYLSKLDHYDIVFRSPGLPVAVLKTALDHVTNPPEVSSAMNLFLALKPCHVIGVTGSKGKGTTSTLIASLLKQSGRPVVLAGNIGHTVFDSYEQLTPETIVVLELSSFQLEDVTHSPDTAVVLPVTSDHLQPLSERSPNFHSSVEVYRQAKANITLHQGPDDRLVFAVDDDGAWGIARQSKAKQACVSQTDRKADYFLDPSGLLWFKQKPLINVNIPELPAAHVQFDASLAIAAVAPLHLTPDQLMEGLRQFRPLPHRMQRIASSQLSALSNQPVIQWIDDSYATNPEATIAALNSLKGNLIWIGGGSSKGADFAELAKSIYRNVTYSIVLGQEAPRIIEAVKTLDQTSQIEQVESIEKAVELAHHRATQLSQGDRHQLVTVLLSPACASTDMFQDAGERGDRFAQAVAQLQGGKA